MCFKNMIIHPFESSVCYSCSDVTDGQEETLCFSVVSHSLFLRAANKAPREHSREPASLAKAAHFKAEVFYLFRNYIKYEHVSPIYTHLLMRGQFDTKQNTKHKFKNILYTHGSNCGSVFRCSRCLNWEFITYVVRAALSDGTFWTCSIVCCPIWELV